MSDEARETEYVYTYTIHEVFSVTATATPNTYSVDIDMTTPTGERSRSLFVSGPTDPYGAGPDVRHWLYNNEGQYEVLPYTPPEPVITPKVPTVIGSAKLTVSDSEISGFSTDSFISGGFCLEEGKFLIFFSKSLDTTDYIVSVFDSGMYRVYVNPDEYFEDSFIVTTTDMAGVPTNPTSISMIVMKAL